MNCKWGMEITEIDSNAITTLLLTSVYFFGAKVTGFFCLDTKQLTGTHRG
jgi:hypothetical protein